MKNLTEDIADRFELPVESFSGVPSVTITGASRVLVENHRGILEYSSEIIDISGGKSLVKIKGEGLLIRAMDRRQILISGKILGVDLE